VAPAQQLDFLLERAFHRPASQAGLSSSHWSAPDRKSRTSPLASGVEVVEAIELIALAAIDIRQRHRAAPSRPDLWRESVKDPNE
ncbi:MAG: hypothetical protein ACOC9Q_02005, partial [bacterium]